MNSTELVYWLGMKTAILGVGVLLAWGLLKLFPVRSPLLHRFIWGCVLLLGLIGAGFSVTIPMKKSLEPISLTRNAVPAMQSEKQIEKKRSTLLQSEHLSRPNIDVDIETTNIAIR